ncbi:MAG TPA: PKD domain-containing protein, partial [Cytophagaceae bacterium]|nr:PKD domain-containing protein [Cytophagaceae bacterium]
MNTKAVRLILLFLTVLLTGWSPTIAFADGIKNQGFILNQGQWPDNVWSRGSFSFGDVIIKKEGIQFFLRDKNNAHHHHGGKNKNDSQTVHAHVYNMKFKNGTIGQPKGSEASTFKVHYIKGNDPAKWVKNLSCHRKLLIENIYPNIDLLLYLNDNGLKYDFVVREKANPSIIKIVYEGVDSLIIDQEGNLQISTSLGTITENIPITFIERANGSKEPVSCQYLLEGNTVHFQTKKISRTRQEKLVIDPKLIFSTYSGSYADNWGNTATYDSSGGTYIAGIAFDSGFPTTTGAFQQSFHSVYGASHPNPHSEAVNGDPDVAIMKYNETGQLVYATYLGGGIEEMPTSMIVNNQGELYILGTTGSRGHAGDGLPFPTTVGAYNTVFKGGPAVYPLGTYEFLYHPYGTDLFVSRLSASGSSLLSSTLIGGTGNDGLLLHDEVLTRNYGDEFRSEILLDSLGFVYIASHTQSGDFINASRPGYDHTFHGGGRDGVVMKLKPDLTDVVWNTYWGGTGWDACYSLQFGKNNDLYITGGTTSTNLVTNPSSVKPNFSGSIDGFILRLSNDGTTLLGSTYIGTSSVDQCQLVQTDTDGNVYVLGQSQGQYPTFNATYSNSSSHQFIHKLNNTLTTTLFSTTIGSNLDKIDLVPTAFLVNDCGKIFISGWGGDLNYPETQYGETAGPYYQMGDTKSLPITSSAFQKTTDGSDFYLMVLDKDAQSLLYATYFGGNKVPEHVDGGTSRFDKRGIVYESVCACTYEIRDGSAPNYPTTPGAHSSTINSYDCNNAVFKFDLNSLKADFTVDTTKVCGISPVKFTNTSLGGTTFLWNLGDGTTNNSSSSFSHTYQQPGTYVAQLIVTDKITCKGIDSIEKIIHVYAAPNPQLTADSLLICKGDTAQLNATYNADYTYTWTPNQYLSNSTINNPLAFPPATQLYTISIIDQTTQCTKKQNVLITAVKASPDTHYKNTTGCEGQASILVTNASDKYGFQYLWDFGDGSTSNDLQQTSHTYANFGDYVVSVSVSNSSCSVFDTVHVHLPPVKIPNLFTPNGDNHNDKYVIEGMTDNWKLEVYNRWGNPIYTREPYDQSWDGGSLVG